MLDNELEFGKTEPLKYVDMISLKTIVKTLIPCFAQIQSKFQLIVSSIKLENCFNIRLEPKVERYGKRLK
jgi:hypothetical protein